MTLCFEQSAPHTLLLRLRVGAPPHCRLSAVCPKVPAELFFRLILPGSRSGSWSQGFICDQMWEVWLCPGSARLLSSLCCVGPSRAVSSRAELPWSFLGFPCSPSSIPPSQCHRPRSFSNTGACAQSLFERTVCPSPHLYGGPSWLAVCSCSVTCLVVLYPDSAVTLLGARLGRMPLNRAGPCSDGLWGNLELWYLSTVYSDTFLGWAQSCIWWRPHPSTRWGHRWSQRV